MILLLQMLLGAAVTAWHLFGGLPPLVAVPLAAWSVALVGLWRRPGRSVERLPFNENPPAAGAMRPVIPPKEPPPACRMLCRDRLAELELAERFSRESG